MGSKQIRSGTCAISRRAVSTGPSIEVSYIDEIYMKYRSGDRFLNQLTVL
jgi:hypothetical protein